MTTIINGSSPSVTFSDSTTQATAGLTGSSTQVCQAWVNFNGSTAAIRASYNVSSITKNGTGDYTINFTNALVDANYAGPACAGSVGVTTAFVSNSSNTQTASAYSIVTRNVANTGVDATQVQVAIFR
jgi:hypothetical protein